MFSNYESLWKAFIRPTRQTYSEFDLGPSRQQFKEYRAYRQDIELKNRDNKIIKCSLFEPLHISKIVSNEAPGDSNRFPCIIYCHGNSGCRLDAVPYLDHFIQRGIGLFCFDFYGSGMSEGEYVTLGFREQNDLADIVKYLRDQPKITSLSLFGRSMGAVTTLLYASTDQDFAALVLDSPFSNLKQLALEVADQKISLPNFIIEGLLSIVNNSIQERAGFRLDQLDLTKIVGKIEIPAIFVTSAEDRLVKQEHPKKLQSLYKGPSQIKMITGDHNEERNATYKKQIADFFEEQISKYLQKKVSSEQKEIQQQDIQKYEQINMFQQQSSTARQERSVSSNSIPFSQNTLLQQNTKYIGSQQIQQNQNYNTANTYNRSTSALDLINNPQFNAAQSFNDNYKDNYSGNDSKYQNITQQAQEQQKKEQANNQPAYVTIDLFDRNVSNRSNEQPSQKPNQDAQYQNQQQQSQQNDGNISARSIKSYHQKSVSISSKIPDYYTLSNLNNNKLIDNSSSNTLRQQEINRIKGNEQRPHSEARYQQTSTNNQQTTISQLSNQSQQQQSNNNNLAFNVQNYIQNVSFNQAEGRYEVSNKSRPLNTQNSSSTSTLCKQTTIYTNEINTNSNTDLSKLLYINQNDISSIYQNTQSSTAGGNNTNQQNSNQDRQAVIDSKNKFDDFQNKQFFKTYDNVRNYKSSKSPTKKISPKNERSENGKVISEKLIKPNEYSQGGNKVHSISNLNMDSSEKNNLKQGPNNNSLKHTYNQIKNSNKISENNFEKNLEDNIRAHSKKLIYQKYQKKREFNPSTPENRQSTMQSVNDEFQEFEVINFSQDLKDDSTPGSKPRSNRNKEQFSHFKNFASQAQINLNNNQNQNTNEKQQNMNAQNENNQVKSENQLSYNQLSLNFLPKQQTLNNFANQPQYLLKSPRVEEKQVESLDQNQKDRVESSDEQSSDEGIVDKTVADKNKLNCIIETLGDISNVELDQELVKRVQFNHIDECSQNFGYEKSRVAAAYSHNTTYIQNKTADDLYHNQTANSFSISQNQLPSFNDAQGQTSTFNEFGMSRKKNVILEQMNTLLGKQNELLGINSYNQIDKNQNKYEGVKACASEDNENKKLIETLLSQNRNNYISNDSNKTTNYIPSISAVDSTSLIHTENDQISTNQKLQECQQNNKNLTSQQQIHEKEISQLYYLQGKSRPDQQNFEFQSQEPKSGLQMQKNTSQTHISIEKPLQNLNNQATVSTQITTSNSIANMNNKNNNTHNSQSNLLSNNPYNLDFVKQQSTESQYNYKYEVPSTNNNNTTTNNNYNSNQDNYNSNSAIDSSSNAQKDLNKINFTSFSNDQTLSFQSTQMTNNNKIITGTQTLRNSKVEQTVKVPRYYSSLDPSPTNCLQNKNPNNPQMQEYPSLDANKPDEVIEGGDSPNTKQQKAIRGYRDSSVPLPAKTSYQNVDFQTQYNISNTQNILSNNILAGYNINNQSTSNTNNVTKNTSLAQQYSLPIQQLAQFPNASFNIQQQQQPAIQTQQYHTRQQSAHLPPKYQNKAQNVDSSNQAGNVTNRQLQSNSAHHNHHQHSNSYAYSLNSNYNPILNNTISQYQTNSTAQQIYQTQPNSLQQPQQQQNNPQSSNNSLHSNSSSTSNISLGKNTQIQSTSNYHQHIQHNKPQSVDFGILQQNVTSQSTKNNQVQQKNNLFKIRPQNASIDADIQYYQDIINAVRNQYTYTNDKNSTEQNQNNTQTTQNNLTEKNYEQSEALQKEKYPIIGSNNDNFQRKKPTQIELVDKEQQQAYLVNSPLSQKKQQHAMAEQITNSRSNMLKLQMSKQINDQLFIMDNTQKQQQDSILQFKPSSFQNQYSQNTDLAVSPIRPQVSTKPSEIKQMQGNHFNNFDVSSFQAKTNNSNSQQNLSTNTLNNLPNLEVKHKNQLQIAPQQLTSQQNSSTGQTVIYTTPIQIKNQLPNNQSIQCQTNFQKQQQFVSINQLLKNQTHSNEAGQSQNSTELQQQQSQQQASGKTNLGLPPQYNSNSSGQLNSQFSFTPSYSQKITNYSGNNSTTDVLSKFKHFTANSSLRNSIENSKINLNFQYYQNQQHKDQQNKNE
ncbi:alpha/beta superfamily hydrolase (macronuclear) [Tetrahymena thermophila SB210]|uniref:Alpha/beta superfamily hydrolase n=1 Tax=Tetrahymena thermophila (strain SB210) TaxID=312017 RepID=Q235X5_TETTS|nr:alpha/beta superfamily hydrolase [Tetrahymena thermophila SB210]EAR92625.1 alpha/beta superfamily hydrolase [Tetrahymena thermophila SB210]|eukprot:XP_001012870.1 alpha/beta superfamily hydrolase [Tetrahymena thermophila SB210]